jgi:hypothetical protein
MPLSNLTPNQITNTVTAAQIPYYDVEEFATLSLEQLQAFSDDRKAAMTEEQIAALTLALSQL